ncbi:hypothetical protein V8C86DRAFT_2649877 [Haematococcus lacustris]
MLRFSRLHSCGPACCVPWVPNVPAPAYRDVTALRRSRKTKTAARATVDEAAPQQGGASPAALAALAALSPAGKKGSKEQADIAALTQSMIMADPDTAEQLKRYEAALARVEAAKAAAKDLEEQYAKAAVAAAQSEAQQAASTRAKASEVMAQAEVAAAERLLQAAQLEAALAAEAQVQLQEQSRQDEERVESLKAGVACMAGGTAVALPLLLLAPGEAGALSASLALAASLVSCFLFGPTYRYAVRLDSTNSHLRGGVVAAFGLVRAAAAADVLQASSSAGPLDVGMAVGPGALYAGQSMLLFAFAAVALELAFSKGWVRRFGAQ